MREKKSNGMNSEMNWSIKTINEKPKKRRVGRYTGMTNRSKKAIVTLKEGQTIDLG